MVSGWRLNRLLTPIRTLWESLEHNTGSLFLRSHKFASEHRIRLDSELDLEHLDFQKVPHGYASKGFLKWMIRFDMTLDRKYNNVPTASKIVQIYQGHPLYERIGRYECERASRNKRAIRHLPICWKISLERLYGLWLPTLTAQSIKSADLLDQVLVCYTVKRAQNGDKKAFDKLYGLYEKRACSEQTQKRVLKLIQSTLSRRSAKDAITPLSKVITQQTKQKKPLDDEAEDVDGTEDTSSDGEPAPKTSRMTDSLAMMTKKHFDNDESDDFLERFREEQQEDKRPHKPNLGILQESNPVDDKFLFSDNARDWLRYIIRGITPDDIMTRLVRETGEEDFALPSNVSKIYITHLCTFVPNIITRYLEFYDCRLKYLANMHSRETISDTLHSVIDLTTELGVDDQGAKALLDFFENAYSQSDSGIILLFHLSMLKVVVASWESSVSLLLEVFNPYTLINDTIPEMLSFCYRPDKMSPRRNLTTWLFGGWKENYKYGKLYQALKEHYMPSSRGNLPSYSFTALSNPCDDSDYYDPVDPESEDLSIEKIPKCIVLKDYKENALAHLMSKGVSKSHAEIFLKRELHKIPDIELEKEYNITPRQIQRICKQINGLIGLSK